MPYDPFSNASAQAKPGMSQTDAYGRTYNYNSGQWEAPAPTNTGWTAQTRTNLMQSGADFSPYQTQLNQLLTDPSKIQQTPGYQFALGQGNEAINRSAAAKGMLNSGGVLAELQKYGQGMASQEYGGQVNRLAELMRNAQQFGVQSGQFRPTTYGTPMPSNLTSWGTSSY